MFSLVQHDKIVKNDNYEHNVLHLVYVRQHKYQNVFIEHNI